MDDTLLGSSNINDGYTICSKCGNITLLYTNSVDNYDGSECHRCSEKIEMPSLSEIYKNWVSDQG